MRSTQIRAYAADHPDIPCPTAQQMFRWARDGLLRWEMRGDRGGRYRWWPPAEVEVAFLVAQLMRAGFRQELAFALARDGRRWVDAEALPVRRGFDLQWRGCHVTVWMGELPPFPDGEK
jgi:hypothetical protein